MDSIVPKAGQATQIFLAREKIPSFGGGVRQLPPKCETYEAELANHLRNPASLDNTGSGTQISGRGRATGPFNELLVVDGNGTAFPTYKIFRFMKAKGPDISYRTEELIMAFRIHPLGGILNDV